MNSTHPSWFKNHLIKKGRSMAGKTKLSGSGDVGGGDWITALNNMKSNVVTEINTQVVNKCSRKLLDFSLEVGKGKVLKRGKSIYDDMT